MGDPSTPVAAPAAAASAVGSVSDAALRIVLFGMPAAGKSSLLGAVAQAAQSQEHLLNGRLTDRSANHGLAELKRRVYEEKSRPTAEEVIPYPIEFEPFATDDQAAPPKVEALFIDCDGRVANDLLARRRGLRDDSTEGTLAREVLDADALVLAIDAAAPPSQVEADFAEFGRFLRLLELSRGQASEVGGLPVFLVLTKCDLLAGPDDSTVDWVDRIEERKRQVYHRFKVFLERQAAEQGPLPFGQIDLHVWATAVKRPALGPTPAKPREPYGVAELFRQSLEYAERFRRRHERSGRWLLGLVGAAVGVVGAMLAAVLAVVLLHQYDRPSELRLHVENYRSREEPTPSKRLREPLQPKISELADFRNHRDFTKLPPDLQEYVEERLKELRQYSDYKARVDAIDRDIGEILADRDLEGLEQELRKAAPPPEYAKEWENTQASVKREERLADIKKLDEAAARLAKEYDAMTKEGEALLQKANPPPGTPFDARKWAAEVQELLTRSDPIESRKTQTLSPDSTLPYSTAASTRPAQRARLEWEAVRKKLDQGRKVGSALGVIDPVPGYPPLLVIDPAKFSFSETRDRLYRLRDVYRTPETAFEVKDLPAPLAAIYRREAELNYNRLLDVGRREIELQLRRHRREDAETPELWDRVLRWLTDSNSFDSWQKLAQVLGPLGNPERRGPNYLDPVEELKEFLRQKQFVLNLAEPALEMPEAIKPGGRLEIIHPPTSGADQPAVVYEVVETGRDASRGLIRYQGRLLSGPRTLTYNLGDGLYARLNVFNNGQDGWRLTWARGRSEVYQFEHLAPHQPPQLHRGDDLAGGSAAKTVTLTFTPPLPKVPELIPQVR